MKPTRLLSAISAAALLASPVLAHAQAPKTEAAAKAQTGKASTDAPANTAVQGTARAVGEAARPAAAQEGAAPAAGAAMAKPVVVNGDLVDTLKLNGQFMTFTQALADTNLAGLLKQNANLTVFAPTDAAFAAMPADQLAKLKADKAAMQRFLLHHIVNAPIPSAKIKGAKGEIPSGAGDKILLDGSDEAGALKVDGAKIIQADVKTGSGLLQVVDHVLVAGQGAAEPATASSAPAAPAADASATAKQ
jgi:uncharacterized surface protein with fasciclin (FAS1) repeats